MIIDNMTLNFWKGSLNGVYWSRRELYTADFIADIIADIQQYKKPYFSKQHNKYSAYVYKHNFSKINGNVGIFETLDEAKMEIDKILLDAGWKMLPERFESML